MTIRENINLPHAKQSHPGVMLTATLILLLPLMAMQVTDEVVWDLTDFAVAWALLVGAGFMYKVATSKTGFLSMLFI